jgi:GMP synthase PP-ATPase subunit
VVRAVLLPVRTVGVMGDDRTDDQVCGRLDGLLNSDVDLTAAPALVVKSQAAGREIDAFMTFPRLRPG